MSRQPQKICVTIKWSQVVTAVKDISEITHVPFHPERIGVKLANSVAFKNPKRIPFGIVKNSVAVFSLDRNKFIRRAEKAHYIAVT